VYSFRDLSKNVAVLDALAGEGFREREVKRKEKHHLFVLRFEKRRRFSKFTFWRTFLILFLPPHKKERGLRGKTGGMGRVQ
jgi:hypothetical protein